jgi:divalent metal cation (Fe/Co/Zn/Cd) transporter
MAVGRRRLEPIAIFLLACIMSMASIQVIVEAVKKIISLINSEDDNLKFSIASIVISAVTIGMSICMSLYVCLFLSMYVSVCLCMCVCVSVYVYAYVSAVS